MPVTDKQIVRIYQDGYFAEAAKNAKIDKNLKREGVPTHRQSFLFPEELGSFLGPSVQKFFKELDLINENIQYKKTMVFILKKQLFRAIIHILKFPNNLKKLKLLIAIILPKLILEKIKNF